MQGNRNDALVRHSAWLQGLKVRLSLQMQASATAALLALVVLDAG
jgi:hypothetical protein